MDLIRSYYDSRPDPSWHEPPESTPTHTEGAKLGAEQLASVGLDMR